MASCNVTPLIPAASRKARTYFFLNTGTPGVRFLQYDEPTEQTFFELFESVGFISDCRDTAKKNEQGFVVCAKDIDSIDRDSSPDANGFTKSVLPHQLPNVYAKEEGCGIEIKDVVNTRDCCDGTAKDFEVTNIMIVDDNGNEDVNGNPNPVEVTQSGPGCDTLISFKPTDVHNDNGVQTEPGKIVVGTDDTASQYLSEVFTTDTPCTTEIIVTDADVDGKSEVHVNVNPFLCDEVRMYGGGNVTICFPSGVGQGQYEGWYLCDGNNGTVDLSEKFVAGYSGSGNYSIIGEGAGTSGFTLGPTQVPLRDHNHTTTISGSLTAAANGSEHQHRITTNRLNTGPWEANNDCGRIDYAANLPKSSSNLWYTGAKKADGCAGGIDGSFEFDGDHTHTINVSGLVVNINSKEISSPIEPVEFTPPFITLAYIQYKGTTLCPCNCG